MTLAPARAAEVLRRLVLVAAAVCLLGTGGAELARPLVGAAVAAATPTGAQAEPEPGAAVGLRSVLAAATPVSTGDDATPAAAPDRAPHLLSRPVVRPPVHALPPAPANGPDARGPPAPAGT